MTSGAIMDTNNNRHGESGAVPFRSGRYFVVANQWYFSTREGFNKGPYSTKGTAENALDTFIDRCKKVNEVFQ